LTSGRKVCMLGRMARQSFWRLGPQMDLNISAVARDDSVVLFKLSSALHKDSTVALEMHAARETAAARELLACSKSS